MKIAGLEIKKNGDGHIVGPYPIERVVDCMVESGETDETGGPILVPGKKTVIYGIYTQPIWDYKEFNTLCPAPIPQVTGFSKKGNEADPRSPEHLSAIETHNAQRAGYTLLKALEPSQLELDGTSLSEPATWANAETALKEMFSHFEYNRIIGMIDQACGIDADKLTENRASFLAQQPAHSAGRAGPTSTS